MKQYYPNIGIAKLCKLFGKTRQAFYDNIWRNSDEQLQHGLIIESVKSIRNIIPGIGTVPLHRMLKPTLAEHNVAIGRDSFFILLRNNNLLLKRRKRYAKTTDSNHRYHKWPNLVTDLNVQEIHKLWVSDITYLRTEYGFTYLSLITDVYSRKIVGYHASQNLKAQGCIITLKKAISQLPERKTKLIHHSDRGIQYCCDQYVDLLKQNKIRISMTQSGSPYDNAIAERVNGILKHQFGLDRVFENYSSAVAAVSKAVAAYNCLRPHSSISFLTPQNAHVTTQALDKKWKHRNRNKKQL